jgi:hypothetical protein
MAVDFCSKSLTGSLVFHFIRGHSGNWGNDMADEVARATLAGGDEFSKVVPQRTKKG